MKKYNDNNKIIIKTKQSIKVIWNKLTVLSTVLTILAFLKTLIAILMAAFTVINLKHYTYWNYLLHTFFYDILFISFFLKNTYLLRFVTFFLFPIVFSSVIFVYSYILVVLEMDGGELFITATTFDGGFLDVGTVHTLDHLVHTFTLISFLMLLCSGYIDIIRGVIRNVSKQMRATSFERFIFIGYFFVVPITPLALYSSIFNPTHEYPTEVNPVYPVLIGIALYIIIQWWIYAITNTKNFGYFFKKK